jgi:hypothetical protein
MRDHELPPEVSAGATRHGNEYDWSRETFPPALEKGCALGFACLGGEFQFVTPKGIHEMYWLSVGSDDRYSQESWTGFQRRSCRETLELFNKRLTETDFAQEARQWGRVRELSGPGAKPLDYLRFVAYFVTEEECEALAKRRS